MAILPLTSTGGGVLVGATSVELGALTSVTDNTCELGSDVPIADATLACNALRNGTFEPDGLSPKSMDATKFGLETPAGEFAGIEMAYEQEAVPTCTWLLKHDTDTISGDTPTVCAMPSWSPRIAAGLFTKAPGLATTMSIVP